MKRPLRLLLIPALLGLALAGYYRHRQGLNETTVQAATEGNTAALLDALERGADPNSRDGERVAVLCSIAARGDIVSAQALVRMGARVNTPDANGMTPLFHAARKGREDLVELFLHDYFPQEQVAGTARFRITRNSDIVLDDESAHNLPEGLGGCPQVGTGVAHSALAS